MIGKIFIKDLLMPVTIGHVAPERHAPQTIRINIAVWADISDSLKSQSLDDTIDYVAIQKRVMDLAATSEYVLLESFADDILTACLENPRASKAWVRIEKPHKFPESESVGLEVERSR